MLGPRLAGKIRRAPATIFNLTVKSCFDFFQSLGLHVTPVHYYEPIPDTRKLSDDLWDPNRELIGIDFRPPQQLALLEQFRERYSGEYNAFHRGDPPVPYEFTFKNPSFGPVDAELLHCMVRHFKPRRLFEIGSGNSTFLSAKAAIRNREEDGVDCEVVAFEPYPTETLRAGFPGLTRLARVPAQAIPFSEFEKLEENDILFIDSSHVLRIGSDVQYEYLDVLPRLKKGVIIHVHDIFLPSEYPRDWVMRNHIFWNEQYLLQAFLTFNERFEILLAASYLHLRHKPQLEAAFPSSLSRPTWPGSFWMRKVV